MNYFKLLSQLPYTASEQYQDMRVWQQTGLECNVSKSHPMWYQH
jgi:hypothetical protein